MIKETIEQTLDRCFITHPNHPKNVFCEGCPYEKTGMCREQLAKDAINYINHLKAENEDMHGEIMSYKAYIDNHEEIWKSNAEVDNKRFVDNMKNVLEIEKKQIRKDTAKEVLQKWAHHNAVKGDEDGYVYYIAEDYDVEVDDE